MTGIYADVTVPRSRCSMWFTTTGGIILSCRPLTFAHELVSDYLTYAISTSVVRSRSQVSGDGSDGTGNAPIPSDNGYHPPLISPTGRVLRTANCKDVDASHSP